jgi:hypothetical protein
VTALGEDAAGALAAAFAPTAERQADRGGPTPLIQRLPCHMLTLQVRSSIFAGDSRG